MTPQPTSADRRRPITAPDAPEAIGPYSHAVVSNGMLYASGALPLDPGTGELVEGSVAAQTTKCLENLDAVCHAAETSVQDAARLTIYTTRLEAFAEINDAYGAWFTTAPPARVAIGVKDLPKGASVEIDAIVPTP